MNVLKKKQRILIHLVVATKSPLIGVKIFMITGKKGGNSVTGVNVPFELWITAPLPD